MIELTMGNANRWYTDERTATTGFCFLQNTLYKGAAFYELIKQLKNENELNNMLSASYGRFAFVLMLGDKWVIAADTLRTIPLYYRRTKNSGFRITDEPDRILTETDRISADAAHEFHALGYVLGNETLIDGLYATEGGSYLTIDNEGGVVKHRYMEIVQGDELAYEECVALLQKSYAASFDRMIRYLDGRQAVVPLSGGMDSRFILGSLAARGYKNIVAFTYGREQKDEVLYSKAIAEKCGVKWVFVPYQDASMRKMHKVHGNKATYFCGHYNTFLLVQDYYAIWYLLENKLIDRDAVVMPGHALTSDMEESPNELKLKESFTKADLAKIYEKNNYLFSKSTMRKREDMLLRRLSAQIFSNTDVMTPQEAYIAMRDLHYRERECKLLVNSTMVYRYFGLDVYMPLFDTEVVKACENVSWQFGDRRAIYYDLVSRAIPDVYAVCPGYGHESEYAPQASAPLSFKKKLKARLPRLYNLYNAVHCFRKDNMNLMGIASKFAYFQSTLDGVPHINGIMIREGLKSFKKRHPN